LNGYQPDAGPKYQVNASSGFFPWPPANPGWSGVTARRLRVLRSDVEVAFNFGARFFVEGQYIHPEDSPEDDIGRSGNNASYREVVLANDGSITAYNGLTVQKKAAIESWPVLDPQAVVNRADIEGEGSLLVGHRVWDNGNGTWDYEYAVFNMNVDRSIGSFQVPVPDDVTITNTGTHDVDYHSGEPYSGTDWPGADGAGTFTWATDSFISNPNANAIRWATLYNFRFTASAPPVDGHVSLGFFKPGVLTAVDVAAKVPAAAAPCPADVDESGEVDFGDLLALLSVWGSCPGCAADLDESGNVDFSDLLALLAAWGPC